MKISFSKSVQRLRYPIETLFRSFSTNILTFSENTSILARILAYIKLYDNCPCIGRQKLTELEIDRIQINTGKMTTFSILKVFWRAK